jgi:crossover junction endodeoxyribonuclease RuvC
MKILGVDPGTRVVGYGVIETKGTSMVPLVGGVIRTRQQDPLSRKLKQIHENMRVVLARSRADVVAVEQVFYGKNISSLIKIGEARGVILAACAMEGLETAGYSPAEVKKTVTGNGRASKSQVREMVRVLLGNIQDFQTDDVSDALAVAICHAQRAHFQHWISQ